MNFFNKNFFGSKDRVGFDISDNYIKFAQVGSSKKGNILNKIGSLFLPVEIVKDGKVKNEEALKDSIREAYKRFNLNSKNIIYAVPEKNVFHRTIISSQNNENKIDEIVKWEINSDRQESVDNFYYTWNIVDHFEDKDKNVVDISFVRREIVEQMDKIFEDLGLQVQGCEFESNSYLNYLPRNNFFNKSLLVVDISDKNSNFTIYDKGNVKLTTENSFSSQLMTDILAKTFNVSLDDAEKMKTTQDIGLVFNNDHFFQAVQPVVEGIVMDAKNLEEFYLNQDSLSSPIEDILIVGGGAKMKGLSKYLAFELDKNELCLHRDGNVCLKNLDLKDDDLVQYAVAIGTALS